MDWKYQLGLIVPSWNTTMEYEISRMAPPGVSIHSSRITHTDDSLESLLHMVELAPESAQLLAHANVQAICFGCTGASFIKTGIDRDVIHRMESMTNIPATTTSTALQEALIYLEIKSVAIASPYPERSNDLLAKYLALYGIKVVSQKGLSVTCPAFLPPENAYKAAKEANSTDAEGIIISCTNFRSLEVIEQLEQDLGKPVISSNTASMWKLLQLAGVKERGLGMGRLSE